MKAQITFSDLTEEAQETLSQLGFGPQAVLTVTTGKSQAGRSCLCGCGETTRGGLWVPGHDAKRKSHLYGLVRGEDTDAAQAALDELTERGWPLPAPKKAKEEAPADVVA